MYTRVLPNSNHKRYSTKIVLAPLVTLEMYHIINTRKYSSKGWQRSGLYGWLYYRPLNIQYMLNVYYRCYRWTKVNRSTSAIINGTTMSNYSTKINKAINYLSPDILEQKKIHNICQLNSRSTSDKCIIALVKFFSLGRKYSIDSNVPLFDLFVYKHITYMIKIVFPINLFSIKLTEVRNEDFTTDVFTWGIMC